MGTLKPVLMSVAILVLAGIAWFAFTAPAQMAARRDSEVWRLFSDRGFYGWQIAWVVLGIGSASIALFLIVRLCRFIFTHRK